MEPWLENQIRTLASDIRQKLRGGKLFGEPIDTTHPDMMIVAAYWLAYYEREEHWQGLNWRSR